MIKLALICLFAALATISVPGNARSDSIDKQFDDFVRQQEKFAAQDRKKREEGYVLQRFYDPTGQNNGQLSLGGGPDPEPVYGTSSTYNFSGRNFEEKDEGGILNLRLKF